ncbi:MAG: DNA repair protein RecN [bacterium]|nr:DNA repair protein RecN [bacterium]
MLRALRVSDLAIIDEIELILEPGFNVVTGETGAGKSILLQALDVALGGRPDADLVRTGKDEAVVEALFTDVPEAAREVLKAGGLPGQDGGDDLVIRRVIAAGGRTRCYVNGSMGTLALLRDLAPHLVRVYGQDEHQALRRVESHRELLDAAGGLASTVEEMRRRHATYTAAKQALEDAKKSRAAVTERAELLRFQAEELAKSNPEAGEEAALTAERTRLAHAERLGMLAGSAERTLYSDDGAAVDAIGRALGFLREAEKVDAAVEPVRTLVEGALAELEEAGAALGKYTRGLQHDPARLEQVEDRLAELGRLKRKYGVGIDELVHRRDQVVLELQALERGDEALDELVATLDAAERDAREWAKRLSVERRRVAMSLERSLVAELKQLSFDGARFQVRFTEGENKPLWPTGWDEVEFYLAANRGEELRPLAKVASGGELSRIMLALKTLTAAEEHGATLIFDEVDAGVGGAVAETIGKKLRQLGRRRQVLNVTHLPVIAAFAEHHVMVAKDVVEGRTVSSAKPLSNSERVTELARMLGGARLTREAQEHAEELLRQGGNRPG